MAGSASPVVAALGVGVALAGAPGPVQAILLAESVRGGIPRGLRALAGVHMTFGLLLSLVALGLSVRSPGGAVLRAFRVGGGILLLWLAIDALRSSRAAADPDPAPRRTLPPAVRGALSIVLNPGAWLFVAVVATPLFATATRTGGRGAALLAAGALVAGAFAGDLVVVVLGATGLRRARAGVLRLVQLALAVVLAGAGLWLVITGIVR